MLFLYVCAATVMPRRVIESGRARGQSTAILARSFPALPVISVEYDAGSPDVPVAAQRLAAYANVDLRFGDATAILPAIVEPGDIVLIDGPKGFRGLRLALSLLATGKPSLVFVHDTAMGTPERSFLERHVPGCLFSDHPSFAAVAHKLDAAVADTIPAGHRFGDASYGYSLACLAHRKGLDYSRLRWRAIWSGMLLRLLGRKAEA
jgi:hypothetical protein